MITIHLIANAHLDPVWLWDAREGLNEGITTCRTILGLMDEFPELTFIRGESAIYRHIETFAPDVFERIQAAVQTGRWDIVGGTYIQPDTNLTGTATLLRHFEEGRTYFADRFGAAKVPTIAWAADSFGHSAGLPEILAASGIDGFAFTRPFRHHWQWDYSAFWWEGDRGARVLAYRPPVGVYVTERDELPRRLDGCRAEAERIGRQTIACFYGVGNHGGGPTRRYMQEIARWQAENPEVRVVHSGLHPFFAALRQEAKDSPAGDGLFPSYRGELNFCLRGCYSQSARVKYAYRKAEAATWRAERTIQAVARSVEQPLPGAADQASAWGGLLFNSFHDILPGTSIERALEEQIGQIRGASYSAQRAEAAALTVLARQIDTSVATPKQEDQPSPVSFLVFNPHPTPYSGPIELEACLDYRPLFGYENRSETLRLEVRGGGEDGQQLLPFQIVENENQFFSRVPWRRRVVTSVEIPTEGWRVVTIGLAAPEPPAPVSAPEPNQITNNRLRISATPGGTGIEILRDGVPLLGTNGLSAITVEDPWGAWGGMEEEQSSLHLNTVRQRWTIDQVSVRESGSERSSLWVRLLGGNSHLDLTLSLYRDRDAVDVDARLFWNERDARLKLSLPTTGTARQARFEVPGGTVDRLPGGGEVPGGRYVYVTGDGPTIGFASDALYNFAVTDEALQATVVRSSRYSADFPSPSSGSAPWVPVTDSGELRFRFLITGNIDSLPYLSEILEQPPIVLPVPAAAGRLARTGSTQNP